jgi:hypothetical protein
MFKVDEFWVVWNERGNAPTMKHFTEQSAMREAERLANKVPGEVFHVLKQTKSCKHQTVVWTEHYDFDENDLPF